MRWQGWLLLAAGTAGCTSVENFTRDQVDSTLVGLVDMRSDSGRVRYDGSSSVEVFDIEVRSWGNGNSRARATDRMQNNDFAYGVEGDTFLATARSGQRAGVDFDVLGPGLIDTSLIADSGTVDLSNVEGFHIATGRNIIGRNIIGEVDFVANGGDIDVTVIPYFNGAYVYIELNGDENSTIDLGLPFGLDYDLTVEYNPNFILAFDDLGFDTLVLETGLMIGRRGFRDVRVDVVSFAGDVRIYEL